MLILIALISCKEPEDSHFFTVEVDVCEAVKYPSLWFTKDPSWTIEKNMLFVVIVMDLHMLVNQYPRLLSVQ